MSTTEAAYRATRGVALDIDPAFHARIAGATEGRILVERFEVPIRSRRAISAGCGETFACRDARARNALSCCLY